MSTCQICGREIKTVRAAAGGPSAQQSDVIAHHGFQRPGNGWQTSSCFGARWRSYEVACDALPAAIEQCQAFITMRKSWMKNWTKNPPETISEMKTNRWGVATGESVDHSRPECFVVPKETGSYTPHTYEGEHMRQRLDAERDIRASQRTLAALQKRLAEWPNRKIS